MSSIQYAPADVPKDHWAYSAVNELFQNRLMDGYPAGEPLSLRKIARNNAVLIAAMRRWKQEGLSAGIPDGLSKYPPDLSNPYEQAVRAWSCYQNILQIGESSDAKRLELAIRELPHAAEAMCMLQEPLRKLGGDPAAVISDLEKFRQRHAVRFRG